MANRMKNSDRKVKTLGDGEIRVYVMKSIEWDEFRVELWQNGIHIEAADYFTDDRKDAIQTASRMLETAEIEQLTVVEKFDEENGNEVHPVTLYKRANKGFILVYGEQVNSYDDLVSAVGGYLSACQHARECAGEFDDEENED